MPGDDEFENQVRLLRMACGPVAMRMLRSVRGWR